jgi:hypothetical protein
MSTALREFQADLAKLMDSAARCREPFAPEAAEDLRGYAERLRSTEMDALALRKHVGMLIFKLS